MGLGSAAKSKKGSGAKLNPECSTGLRVGFGVLVLGMGLSLIMGFLLYLPQSVEFRGNPGKMGNP